MTQLHSPRPILGRQKDAALGAVQWATALVHPSVKVRAPFRSSDSELTDLCIEDRPSVRGQRANILPALQPVSVSIPLSMSHFQALNFEIILDLQEVTNTVTPWVPFTQ